MSKLNQFTGEIYDPCGQKYIEWKVNKYFSLPQKAGTYIVSPIFHFSNASWFLMIYPNGSRESSSIEWMSLYLGREDCRIGELAVTYTLGILDKDGQVHEEISGEYDFRNNLTMYGRHKFIKRCDLERKMNLIAPGGTLTVFCKTEYSRSVADAASQTVFHDGVDTLIQDFHKLLQDEKKSDVTIKVKDRLFRVHKLILGARSSVFSAMFEHNMKENRNGVVDIADCEPDTFQDFLSFVYTGKIPKLSSSDATGLYSLADKYDLSDLRVPCLNYMKVNMKLDRVCDIFAVADRHSEQELKTSAAELIRKNIKKLLPTKQWISFMAGNPTLAAELLMTAIPENVS